MNLRGKLKFTRGALDGPVQTAPAKNHDTEPRSVVRLRLLLDDKMANELGLYQLVYDSNDMPRSGFTTLRVDGILENVHIHVKSDQVAFTAMAERLSGIMVERLGRAPLEGMSLRMRAIFHGWAEQCAMLVAKLTEEDSFEVTLTPAQMNMFEDNAAAAEELAEKPKRGRGRPRKDGAEAPPPSAVTATPAEAAL